MDQVSETLNVLITNAKRDKKMKIPSEIIQKMQTLSSTVNDINEIMAQINNGIQET
jgi:phage-related protein